MGGLRNKRVLPDQVHATEHRTGDIIRRLKINLKQRYFCQEFIIDYDPEKAAVRSGYDPKYGYTLLKMPKIIECITEFQSIDAAYNGITTKHLKGQMAIWANINVASFYDKDYNLKPLDELTPAQQSCIQNIEKKYDKDGRVEIKIKLVDKQQANILLGKHLQLYDAPKENFEIFDDMSDADLVYWLDEYEPGA